VGGQARARRRCRSRGGQTERKKAPACFAHGCSLGAWRGAAASRAEQTAAGKEEEAGQELFGDQVYARAAVWAAARGHLGTRRRGETERAPPLALAFSHPHRAALCTGPALAVKAGLVKAM